MAPSCPCSWQSSSFSRGSSQQAKWQRFYLAVEILQHFIKLTYLPASTKRSHHFHFKADLYLAKKNQKTQQQHQKKKPLKEKLFARRILYIAFFCLFVWKHLWNTNKHIHLFIVFLGKVHIKTNFSFVRLLSMDCLQSIEMGSSRGQFGARIMLAKWSSGEDSLTC